MKIIIDADASPIIHMTKDIAKANRIDLVLVSDINHLIDVDYGEVIQVDHGLDEADHTIVGLVEKGDLVITQDYGLASLVLMKQASAMHHNGWFYTNQNIDGLLMQRQMAHQMRKKHKRYQHIPKRTKDDDEHFRQALTRWLEKEK